MTPEEQEAFYSDLLLDPQSLSAAIANGTIAPEDEFRWRAAQQSFAAKRRKTSAFPPPVMSARRSRITSLWKTFLTRIKTIRVR